MPSVVRAEYRWCLTDVDFGATVIQRTIAEVDRGAADDPSFTESGIIVGAEGEADFLGGRLFAVCFRLYVRTLRGRGL
jgi:hypothetical protein